MDPEELNLRQELLPDVLIPMGKIENAYLFQDSTPSHKFFKVIAKITGSADFVILIARDFYDPRLAAHLIQFVRQRNGEIDRQREVQIVAGFSPAGYGFDCVLVLGPTVNAVVERRSKELQRHTVQAIPIYRCEFADDDNFHTVDIARRYQAKTLVWNRNPSPRVWMRFSNATTQSIGKKFGLTNVDKALMEIHRIPQGPDGWAELENYLRERIRITYSDGLYNIETSGETMRLSEVELDEQVRQFLW